METTGSWEKLGEVGVNTGLIWIGDPVDVLPDDAAHPGRDWEEFSKRLANEGYTKAWHDNQGQSIRDDGQWLWVGRIIPHLCAAC